MAATENWPTVRIIGPDKELEAWEERVMQLLPEDIFLGSARQTWYDPDAPPPEANETEGGLIVYLQRGSDPANIVEMLRKAATDEVVEIEPFSTPEADWAMQWRRFFRPIKVSKNLAVIPSWYSINEAAKETGLSEKGCKWIRIEPGQAFGSGTHATTRLCLRGLESIMARPPERILDFGAGSGILTIAAAALGAKHITAVEIDPETVANSQENLGLNAEVMEGVTVDHRIGSSEQLQGGERFDLVVCNALYRRVEDHFPALVRVVSPTGRFLYSGFLNEEREEIVGRLKGLGMAVETIDSEEEWGALVASMRGA